MLETDVTSAMPPAAAKPVKNSPGIEMKTGKELYVPIATAERRTTDHNGERGAARSRPPTPVRPAGVARWTRLSRPGWEWCDKKIIAITPRRFGIIPPRPTTVLELPAKIDRIISGNQKLKL